MVEVLAPKTAPVEFRVLGPLEVLIAGEPIDVGPARQRALLAALLVQANRVVSVDRLLEDLWNGSPPVSAPHALQVYVSNLRKLLEPGRPPGSPGETLLTRRPGYLLAVDGERLDAARFEAGVGEGRRALREGCAEAAAATLRSALDLWYGPALADLADEPFCQVEAARLEELRLGATEDRIEADLALGRHAAVVSELEVLVAGYPLRERLWAQLLLALYRSGRQAEALSAYQRLRRSLAEELGLEPGAELRHLEAAILRHDATLDLTPSPAASVAAPEPAPAPPATGPTRQERRTVSAVAVVLSGADSPGGWLAPDELRLILEAALGIMTEAVETYGGSVVEVGARELTAVFGVPGAHENDAERAVRAGLRIVDQVDTFGADVARGWEVSALRAGVGISTGPALVGPRGQEVDGDARAVAVGRPLTAAASLAAAASPGCLLVGSSTRRLVGPLFEWGDADDSVRDTAAFGVVGTRFVPGKGRGFENRKNELCGRDQELAVGTEVVDAVLSGAGGVLIVSGDAGIGKTRLVAQLRRRFEAGGPASGDPLWLEGRCLSFGQSLPYGPFRELLREWLGTSPQQPQLRTRVALRREVEVLFGSDADRLHPLLATVLGLPLERDASDALASRAPDSLHAATFGAVRQLVDRLGTDRPVVVAVDDFHWADPTSLQLIDHLLSTTETAAVLIVLSGRPEHEHPSWQLREMVVRRLSHRTREISLAPLKGDADAQMLRSQLGVAALPPGLLKVLRVAEGNPLFLEELVRSLVEAGTLVQTADGWHCEEDLAVELPQTVEALLLSRIDRLSPSSRDVLTAASVLGRQFALELVEHLCGPATDVSAALQELGQLDLVHEARRWPRREYRFKHALIQEAAYGTLVGSWREELHGRAANGLETLVHDRVAESYALLAHHWRQAGEPLRAVAYHRLAGDGARRVHAVDEALAHYSAGIELTAGAAEVDIDAATRAGLHLGRGHLRWERGDEGAREDLEEALVLAERAGEWRFQLEALEALGLVEAYCHGRRDVALRHFDRGLSLAHDKDDDSAGVVFANRLAIEHVHRLDLRRAFEWGQQALAAGDRVGTNGARARAIDGLKLVAAALGDLPTLRDLTARLRELLSADDDLWYLKFVLAEASLEASGRGRFEEAAELLDEAWSINDRLGQGIDAPYFLTVRAWLERARGAYGAAVRLAREAVDVSDQQAASFLASPRPTWHAWAEANLGVVCLELGACREAIAHLERGLALAEQGAEQIQTVRCCSHLAWAWWRAGDVTRATEHVRRSEQLFTAVTAPPRKAWLDGVGAYTDVARVLRALGESAGAGELLKPLLGPARDSGWYEAISMVSLALANCEPDEHAEELLRAALDSARAGRLIRLEGQAHSAIAETLRLRGDDETAGFHDDAARGIRRALADSIDDPALAESLLNSPETIL